MKLQIKILTTMALLLSNNLLYATPSCEAEDTIYTLTFAHMSGYIHNDGNTINCAMLCKKDDKFEIISTKNIGTFKNKTNLYNTHYVYENKPSNGYNIYQTYDGTKFEGLSTRYIYTASSMKELVSQIKRDVRNGTCQRWPSNTHRGDLNRDDNFWSYFCPENGLITYLD